MAGMGIVMDKTLKLSKSGRDFIEKHEGKRNSVYKDAVGLPTIGIGHLIQKNENIPQTLTDEQVYALFDKDIARFVEAINNLTRVQLNQSQFDALVSFAFNVGINAYLNSTLLRVLNLGDYLEAANQLLRWDKGGDGKPIYGLTLRRQAERDLFLTEPKEESTMNDYENHWAKDIVQWALDNGLIKGYSDGSVKPDNTLTRAEMLTILKNYHNKFGGQ
jgi:lysozyme